MAGLVNSNFSEKFSTRQTDLTNSMWYVTTAENLYVVNL